MDNLNFILLIYLFRVGSCLKFPGCEFDLGLTIFYNVIVHLLYIYQYNTILNQKWNWVCQANDWLSAVFVTDKDINFCIKQMMQEWASDTKYTLFSTQF